MEIVVSGFFMEIGIDSLRRVRKSSSCVDIEFVMECYVESFTSNNYSLQLFSETTGNDENIHPLLIFSIFAY